MKMKLLFILFAFIGFFCTPISSWAKDEIGLKVVVIHATRDPGGVDSSLKRIQSALKDSFGNYKSFKPLAKANIRLSKNDKSPKLQLPNGQTASFRYDGKDGKSHKLHLSIPKSKVNVDLRSPLKRPFFQAGMRYREGILILALVLMP